MDCGNLKVSKENLYNSAIFVYGIAVSISFFFYFVNAFLMVVDVTDIFYFSMHLTIFS